MAPLPHAAIVLLAAGASRRMGTPKQLLDFHGKPLVRHAAEVALAADVGPVVVVLGAHADALRSVLAGLPVHIVVNERWPEGMGTSIQKGLGELALNPAPGHEVAGVILALADQPFVSAGFLRQLVDRHRETGKPIVASQYAGTVGVPAFFARDALGWLLSLRPEQGCKGVILEHSEEALLIDCPEAALDIDTPEDYAQALRNPR